MSEYEHGNKYEFVRHFDLSLGNGFFFEQLKIWM